MKWTIGKKMLLMGIVVVVVLVVMGGISYRTNLFIQNTTDAMASRNNQLQIASDSRTAILELILAAMDSIVDKDAGRITEERMEVISSNTTKIAGYLDEMETIADTDEERQALQNIQNEFPLLTKGIQEDLTRLIEESMVKSREISAAFVEIDDRLDLYGGQLEADLGKMFDSVQEEQIDASQVALLRTQQMTVLDKFLRAHSTLMLEAMDSIIDKHEGRVQEERMQGINDSLLYMKANLDELETLADTDAGKAAAVKIRDTLPKLAEGIQERLVTLIEESSGQLQHIQQDFIQIDDVLDLHGDQIEEDLKLLVASVQQEQIEASNLSLLRNQQLSILDKFLRAHATLMLEAMDSIIDKDKGKIPDERMQKIVASIEFMQANLEQLEGLADTEEEKADAANIRETFPKLADGIQQDLVRLIGQFASEEQFEAIDDRLDEYGDRIEQSLGKMFASVQQEQIEATKLSLLRNQQTEFLGQLVEAHSNLMLAAMDSIIDKDEGQINDARRHTIDANIQYVQDSLDALDALADTEEELAAAQRIRDTLPKLVEGIQVTLVKLIEESVIQGRTIEKAFVDIDDELDEYGGIIEENLEIMFVSVQREQEEATQLSLLRNGQLDVLSRLVEAHSTLMLAAMDSIIDKDEGTIAEERLKLIETNVQFIQDSLDALDELADTGQEKNAAQRIRETFPKVAEGIQVDLLKLIVEGAVAAQQIEQDFDNIDDALDEHGDKIRDSLGIIETSVRNEQKKAQELLQQAIAQAETTLGTTVLVALALLIPGLALFSRSITRPLTNIVAVANDIAEGDLGKKILIERQDEIGSLANAFRSECLIHKRFIPNPLSSMEKCYKLSTS